jgi:hypothetical protein
VARQARAAKSSALKSAVVLDDNLPKSKGGAGSGKLSPDKQAYCDELRQRRNPDVEQSCAALAVDMGPEYEHIFARYIELAKNLCAANGGRLPTGEPKNPTQAAQWHELVTVSTKFAEVMKPETKLLMDAEKGSDVIRQEEYRELDKSAPDWHNPAALAANPQEQQRYKSVRLDLPRPNPAPPHPRLFGSGDPRAIVVSPNEGFVYTANSDGVPGCDQSDVLDSRVSHNVNRARAVREWDFFGSVHEGYPFGALLKNIGEASAKLVPVALFAINPDITARHHAHHDRIGVWRFGFRFKLRRLRN